MVKCERGLCNDEAEYEVYVYEEEWRAYCEDDAETELTLQETNGYDTEKRPIET